MLPSFSYVRPTSLDETVEQLSKPGARLHAGGTDLIGCLRDQVFTAGSLVSLSSVAGLDGLAETAEGGLRVGALVRIAQVAADPRVRARYRALADAASVVASPQLRAQGTIAGNLCQKPRCWYYRGEFHCLRKGGEQCFAVRGENHFHCIFGGDGCYIVHPSDTAPALVALQALARVVGPGGSRVVPVEGFHVAPSVDPQRETVLETGELVTEIVLPAPAPGLVSSYRKVRARGSWDFALAGVALALVIDGGRVKEARVVLSGAAPVPWRARGAEAALAGRKLDAKSAAAAAEAAVVGAEPLEHNGYKLPLFKGLIAEQLEALAPR
jgi:xanthine dehydrogenase YagS FAD-binding subunit